MAHDLNSCASRKEDLLFTATTLLTRAPHSTGASGVTRQQRRVWRLLLVRLTFLLPLLLYVALFYGYPLFYSIQISLERYDLQAEITGVAEFIGLANYVADLQNAAFQTTALH